MGKALPTGCSPNWIAPSVLSLQNGRCDLHVIGLSPPVCHPRLSHRPSLTHPSRHRSVAPSSSIIRLSHRSLSPLAPVCCTLLITHLSHPRASITWPATMYLASNGQQPCTWLAPEGQQLCPSRPANLYLAPCCLPETHNRQGRRSLDGIGTAHASLPARRRGRAPPHTHTTMPARGVSVLRAWKQAVLPRTHFRFLHSLPVHPVFYILIASLTLTFRRSLPQDISRDHSPFVCGQYLCIYPLILTQIQAQVGLLICSAPLCLSRPFPLRLSTTCWPQCVCMLFFAYLFATRLVHALDRHKACACSRVHALVRLLVRTFEEHAHGAPSWSWGMRSTLVEGAWSTLVELGNERWRGRGVITRGGGMSGAVW